MNKTIRLRKGLNIKLKGEPEKVLSDIILSETYAVKPIDFKNFPPKLLVKEGDIVKAGQALVLNKNNEKITLNAPVSGTIKEIARGEKRVLEKIIISADKKNEYIDFGKAIPSNISREEIIEKLLQSGVWSYIRQRPFSIIANPDDKPKSIFISTFDTSPLAPDYDFVMHGKGEIFQIGIDALHKLTEGSLHLCVNDLHTCSKVFTNTKNAIIHEVQGPHPAGNVGIQIHHIDPINKGDIIWYINPQDVLIIGHLFKEGIYDARKIVALAGSEVKHPRYHKVINGFNIKNIIEQEIENTNTRIISGNVLTGKRINVNDYISYYDDLITVIPEGNKHEFLGWAMPRFNKFSMSGSYFSWLTPKKEYLLDTNLNGGERAFVVTGQYEKVLPMDILPLFLIKSILIEDIEQMEKLGIYEVSEEDFALCEFVCTSKMEIQEIIRKGLEIAQKEMK